MKKSSLLFLILSLTCIMSFSFGIAMMSGVGAAASQQKVYAISPCDSLSEFSEENRQGMVNPEIVTEGGRTYFSATTYGEKQVSLLAKTFSPIDLSIINRNNAYLQFSIWVEDKSAISSAGSIELSSSGHSDAEEVSWEFNGERIANQVLESGQWNDISIQISDGASKLGIIDWSSINFFRVFIFTTKQVKIAYDNFRITIVEDMNMPTVFNEGAVNKFVSNNATVSGGENDSVVAFSAGEASLKTSAYEMSAPMASLGMVCLNFTTNEPEKISSVKITITTDMGSAWYNVPVSEAVNYSKKFTEYEGISGAAANFSNVTELKVDFTIISDTKIVISKFCTDTVSNMLVREIDAIGEITFDNFKDKAEQITKVEQIAVNLRQETGAQETYLTQYAYNYLKFKIQKEQFDYYTACVKNGMYMTAYIPKGEYKAGDVLNIVIELKNLSSEYRNDRWTIKFDEWCISPIGATSGKINLESGKSRIIEVPFMIKMGGFTWFTASVVSASDETLAWEDYVVINDKGLYLADDHTHSIQSDGVNALEDNFYTAMTQWKLAFIYATDHNANPGNLADIEYAKKVMEAAGLSDFISLKGSEISGLVANIPGYDYSLAGHMLYFNGDTYYEEPTLHDLESNVYLYQMIMKEIMEEGGYAYLAHPRQGQYRFSVIGEDITRVDVYPDITGIEIFNGWQYAGEYKHWSYSLEAIEYWDRINITGRKKYFAIGNSDAHNVVDLRASYTGFILENYSELSINNALGSGKMYASSGVDLQYTLDGLDMGETIFTDKPKDVTLKVLARDSLQTIKKIKLISYKMNYSSNPEDSNAGYATREEIILYDDQDGEQNNFTVSLEKEITVTPGSFYRIEATSTSDEELAKTSSKVVVRYACSNPIWVENKAGNFVLNAESLNLCAGEEYVLLVKDTDGVYDTIQYSSSAPDKVQVETNGKITVLDNATEGTYFITAKTSSGSVVKTVNVVVGKDVNDKPGNLPDGNGEAGGCNSNICSAGTISLPFFLFVLAIILFIKRKKI